MSERGEAKRDGSRLQKNSGRGKFQKGDAILGPFVIDYKEYSKSYSVSVDNWAKLCTDAQKSGGYEPAFKLVLSDGNVTSRVWVISDGMFMQMLEAWEQKYGNPTD